VRRLCGHYVCMYMRNENRVGAVGSPSCSGGPGLKSRSRVQLICGRSCSFLVHKSKDRNSKSKGEDIRRHHEGLWRVEKYGYAPHNDVSVNDGPHIRQWFHNIIIYEGKSISKLQIVIEK